MSAPTPNAAELAARLESLVLPWRDPGLPRLAADELRSQAARIADLEAALAQQVPEPQPVNAQMLEALKDILMHIGKGREDGVEWVCEPIHRDEIKAARAAIAAAEAAQAGSAQQVPAVPAPKRLIGWRTDDYLHETADPKMAKNWEPHHTLLPIFEGDPHTKLAAAPLPAPTPNVRGMRPDTAPQP